MSESCEGFVLNKYVLISFAFMGWAFWELSGGSDFEPNSRAAVAMEEPVTSSVSTARAEPEQAKSQPAVSPVPLVKASLSVEETNEEVAEEAAVAATAVIGQPQRATSQATGAEVLVASLADGGEAFATPAAQLLTFTKHTPDAQPTADTALATTPTLELRTVRGSRVNLRTGPGTAFDVLTVLTKGQQVQILRQDTSGWVNLRDLDSGVEGWMSAKMLTSQ